MQGELFADKILRLLGRNSAAYPQLDDKWPIIFSEVFSYSLPIIFALLFFVPFIWMLVKKKKFTFQSTVIAIARGIGFIILGIIALYLLIIYLQGEAFKALYGFN